MKLQFLNLSKINLSMPEIFQEPSGILTFQGSLNFLIFSYLISTNILLLGNV